jgi:LIVCS family branched-chain amino acid:cation transporter
MLVATLFGIVDGLKAAGLDGWLPGWLTSLPLAEQGLAWLLPSALMLALASGYDWLRGKPQQVMA